jgi:hypothetical protein
MTLSIPTFNPSPKSCWSSIYQFKCLNSTYVKIFVILESAAQKFQETYSADIDSDFVAEVRSFRREFRGEIEASQTVLDLLKLIISSKIMSSFPELSPACVLFATIPVTVASVPSLS